MINDTSIEASIKSRNLIEETKKNFEALQAKCKKPTQHDRLLSLLRYHKNQWVALPEILALYIAQYGRVINDLRKQGYDIRNRQEGRHSWFMLIEDNQTPSLF